MKKIGEYVIYQKDVCKIIDIKENDFTHKLCYLLTPCKEESLKLTVPVESKSIKELMTQKELEELIKKIPEINIINVSDKEMESEYKRLLSQGKREGLISIIKTTYLRNEKRIENKKKISDKDNKYFQLAEDYLYNEIAIILNISKEDAKEYVIKRVEE